VLLGLDFYWMSRVHILGASRNSYHDSQHEARKESHIYLQTIRKIGEIVLLLSRSSLIEIQHENYGRKYQLRQYAGLRAGPQQAGRSALYELGC